MKYVSEIMKNLSDYDFKSIYKEERNSRIKIKLQALHHLQTGKLLKDVSEIVLYDEKSVREWVYAFEAFNYEGLIEKEGRGQKPRLMPDKEESFKKAIDDLHESRNGGRIIAVDIQKLLLDEFDCNYSLSGVYTLLDRINIVWISGRSKHPKHSQDAIDAFKETFPEEVEKIKDKIDSIKIEVWWQDESRIGQQGSLSRVWAQKGTRPRVVRQKQFLSTYIFGAVCPEKDKGCAMILPECNSGMMQIHLDQISEKIENDFHGIVLMDRASWHTTEALIIPTNITLMPLPPYSPELNPVEQIWQNLRKIKCTRAWEK
ncbi:MAG: hypothetical protein HW410_1901 [Nitrosarchaeum sp.]|nr:hypothetical protein [Nitrosarchaeum sp.]